MPELSAARQVYPSMYRTAEIKMLGKFYHVIGQNIPQELLRHDVAMHDQISHLLVSDGQRTAWVPILDTRPCL